MDNVALMLGIQYNTHTIQYNTIQYNTIQYNTIQYNTIQYNTIQHNTIQHNTIQYINWHNNQHSYATCPWARANLEGELWEQTMNKLGYITEMDNVALMLGIQYNTHTIQYNTIRYNTIQYNTIQHNTIQYNTQYNTTQHNTIYQLT